MKRVLVIGAGAAGLMAAHSAAGHGARVTLLEQKDRVGRKLSITGNGRCNMTAAVDGDALIRGFPGNGRFLYSAFNQFSNWDLIRFFEERGLKTRVEPGDRVFPASGQAAEVVRVLQESATGQGVKLLTSLPVKEITLVQNRVAGAISESERFLADALIIATGGLSYPGTGSTGDGYLWARQAGHRIIEPRPGLVPLVVVEEWIKDLQGLSLREAAVSVVTSHGNSIAAAAGELLFTHYGLSGPIILNMSREIGQHLHRQSELLTMIIDLKPEWPEAEMDRQLLALFQKHPRSQLKNALTELFPPKLIPVLLKLSQSNGQGECHEINRSIRMELITRIKRLTLTISGTRPIQEAIITAGGVDIKDVDPKTMQSKRVKGLFFAGEILDIDGYTGGYNLQAAFSTGYVAGKHAAL